MDVVVGMDCLLATGGKLTILSLLVIAYFLTNVLVGFLLFDEDEEETIFFVLADTLLVVVLILLIFYELFSEVFFPLERLYIKI